MGRNYFHLHLVSDATGETLIAVSRAAAAQYQGVSSIEHIYPLVRSRPQLEKAIAEIAAIVINMNLWTRLKLAQGAVPVQV